MLKGILAKIRTGLRAAPGAAAEADPSAPPEAQVFSCEHALELSPAAHLVIANEELGAGHLTHGLHHLALAIAETPENRTGDGLVTAFAAAAPDIIALLPSSEEYDVYYVACQAALHQRRGELTEALDLLVPLALEVPDVPYLKHWGLPWVQAAPDKVKDEALLRMLFVIYQAAPEYVECLPGELEALEAALALFDSRDMDAMGDVAAALHAGLLRKLGQFDGAIMLARTRYEMTPTWSSAVALGAALQAAGELDSALAPLQHAAALEAEDVSALSVVGEIGLQLGDTLVARQAYEAILQRDPDAPQPMVAILYCNYLESGDLDDVEELRELLDHESDEVADAAAAFLERLTPYVGFLPEPGDSAADMLREALADPDFEPDGPPAHLTLHEFEAPSNEVAFALAFPKLRILLEVTNIGMPDPRVPVSDVTYQVWEYRANSIMGLAAVTPPPPEIASRLSLAARQPYDWERDWRVGLAIMQAFGADGVPGILSTIVHPPKLPAGVSPLVWLPRIQQIACFALAHAGDADADWDRSLSRQILRDLLLGPLDWSCGAAALALARLAQEDPDRTEDVATLLLYRVETRPDQRFCSYDKALAYALLMLPDAVEDTQEAAMRLLSSTT